MVGWSPTGRRPRWGSYPSNSRRPGGATPCSGPWAPVSPPIIGHEDIVTDLPANADCLASSAEVPNEAFVFPGKPIYATQFHPELDREGLLMRIAAYPPYLPLTGARSLEELRAIVPDTAGATGLLRRFVERTLGQRTEG